MQSILTHLPIVMIQNIGFMAILYVLYLFIKQFANAKPSQLFNWALFFYTISVSHFIFTIVYLTITHASMHEANTTLLFDLHYRFTLNVLPYFGLAYILALLFYLFRMFVGYYQVISLKKDTEVYNQFDYLFEENNLPHVPIVTTSKISVPMTIGWWEPIILLPLSMSTNLSADTLKIIILHELAHIIRKDYLVQICIECYHIILCFNPFSYLFKKELQINREMACDEWVIQQTEQPIVYSKLLYQIAAWQVDDSPKQGMKLIDSPNELLLRIKHINKIPGQSIQNWAIKSTIALLSIVLVGLTLFIPTERNHHLATVKTITKIQYVERPAESPTQVVKVYSKATSVKDKKVNESIVSNTKLNRQEKEDRLSKDPVYDEVVKQTLQWLQARAPKQQFVTYNPIADSIAYNIAEKLVISSALSNYQLKKEILNRKLQAISDEKEASELLMNSKEWNDIKQYEKWAEIYLSKHPEARIIDSSYKF